MERAARTATMTTGVIPRSHHVAVLATRHVATQLRRPTGPDRPKSPCYGRSQTMRRQVVRCRREDVRYPHDRSLAHGADRSGLACQAGSVGLARPPRTLLPDRGMFNTEFSGEALSWPCLVRCNSLLGCSLFPIGSPALAASSEDWSASSSPLPMLRPIIIVPGQKGTRRSVA